MNFQESEHVELKAQVTAELCKEVIAFANSDGGTLYIGVQNDGTVIGLVDPDSTILQANNMIRDSIKPDVTMFIHYDTMTVAGKTVLAITVQRGTQKPYYLASKGLKPSGVYVRNGTASDPASDAAIRAMIKDSDGDSYESCRALEQDLSFRAAEQMFQAQGIAFDTGKMKTMGLQTVDGVFTNVGLLLSDQCPSTMKAAVFSGVERDDFQDRREFSGSLLRQLEELYTYIDLHNQKRASFHGLHRADYRDYPEEAIREVLLNSIVHRDYAYPASTIVNLYQDRMEVISIGGLPFGLSLEDVMLGLSVCRNPKLAAVFYRLRLIEAYGTGLPKIFSAYKGSGKEPKIEVTPGAFKVILPNRNAVSATDNRIGDQERLILSCLEQKKSIVRSDVDSLLGCSQATSSRLLKQMSEKRLIVQRGRGKNTRYVLAGDEKQSEN